MVHDLVSVFQHIAFAAHAGIGVFVAQGMVVLLVVQDNVGGIGADVLPVPLVHFLVFPCIAPLHLHIAGLAELTAGDHVDGEVLHDIHALVAAGLGGGLVDEIVDGHLGGLLALQEEGYRAERFGVPASLRFYHEGFDRLGDGLAATIGPLVFNIDRLRSGRDGDVGHIVIPGGHSLGENIKASLFFSAIYRERILFAGHNHHG